jgi:hypothetical protein
MPLGQGIDALRKQVGNPEFDAWNECLGSCLQIVPSLTFRVRFCEGCLTDVSG